MSLAKNVITLCEREASGVIENESWRGLNRKELRTRLCQTKERNNWEHQPSQKRKMRLGARVYHLFLSEQLTREQLSDEDDSCVK